MGRRTAQDAAAAGLEHVTVEMLLPECAAEEAERLDDAVSAADTLCSSEQLLTLESAGDPAAAPVDARGDLQPDHARPGAASVRRLARDRAVTSRRTATAVGRGTR